VLQCVASALQCIRMQVAIDAPSDDRTISTHTWYVSSVLQRVASVLQCVASVLQVCCSMLQVCCNILECNLPLMHRRTTEPFLRTPGMSAACCKCVASVLQVCCSVLQVCCKCVAVCCSVLQDCSPSLPRSLCLSVSLLRSLARTHARALSLSARW